MDDNEYYSLIDTVLMLKIEDIENTVRNTEAKHRVLKTLTELRKETRLRMYLEQYSIKDII